MTTKFELFFNRIKMASESQSDKQLYEFLGISKSRLSMWKSREKVDYELLFTKFEPLSINLDWLLTGRGEMMKPESVVVKDLGNATKDPTLPYSNLVKIPFVSVSAVAGFGSGEFSIAERDVKAYYVIPKFKDRKIDFMIEVNGSSMYPKYNSGDVVACRIIKESNFTQWNKVHVVATTEQGILVKRLKRSKAKGCLLAVSDNKDYEPFDIPEAEITGIAIVVGVVRLE